MVGAGTRLAAAQLAMLVLVLQDVVVGEEAFTVADDVASWTSDLISDEDVSQLAGPEQIPDLGSNSNVEVALAPQGPSPSLPPTVGGGGENGHRADWRQPIAYEGNDGREHIWVSSEVADCDGFFSECTVACEQADLRTWTEKVAQRGDGLPCPASHDCAAGEGACPPLPPNPRPDVSPLSTPLPPELPPLSISNASDRSPVVYRQQDGSNGDNRPQAWSAADLLTVALSGGLATVCLSLLFCVAFCPTAFSCDCFTEGGQRRRKSKYGKLSPRNSNHAAVTEKGRTRKANVKASPRRYGRSLGPKSDPELELELELEPEPELKPEQDPDVEIVIEPMEKGMDTSIGSSADEFVPPRFASESRYDDEEKQSLQPHEPQRQQRLQGQQKYSLKDVRSDIYDGQPVKVYSKRCGCVVDARVEQVFAWGVCRVSYRTPESDHKVIVKSLRIEDLIPADVGNSMSDRASFDDVPLLHATSDEEGDALSPFIDTLEV